MGKSKIMADLITEVVVSPGGGMSDLDILVHNMTWKVIADLADRLLWYAEGIQAQADHFGEVAPDHTLQTREMVSEAKLFLSSNKICDSCGCAPCDCDAEAAAMWEDLQNDMTVEDNETT